MKTLATISPVLSLLYAPQATLAPAASGTSKMPRPKAKPALKKLLLLAFLLPAANASFASFHPATLAAVR